MNIIIIVVVVGIANEGRGDFFFFLLPLKHFLYKRAAGTQKNSDDVCDFVCVFVVYWRARAARNW